MYGSGEGGADVGDGFDQCVPDDFSEAAQQLVALETVVRAQLVQVIRAVLDRELWIDDGATDLAEWVAQTTGVGSRTASELAKAADVLRALPAIATAFDRGEIGWDRLRHLIRFATPDDDAALAVDAPGWSVPRVEMLARRAARITREQADENERTTDARITWNRDKSRATLTAHFDAADAATIEAAVDREAGRHPKDPLTDLYVPYSQRAAHALISMASARLGTDADPDRATVVVHTDVAVLVGDDGHAELDNGVPVSLDTVRRLACDGRLQVVTENADGKAVGVGRAQRTVPAWLRRLVQRRDQQCRFPGCRRTHLLDVHHWEFWQRDGGATDLDNLFQLCRFHHRLVHEGGWAVTGHPDRELVFTRPDGRAWTSRLPGLRPAVAERAAPLLPFPTERPSPAIATSDGESPGPAPGPPPLRPTGTDPPPTG